MSKVELIGTIIGAVAGLVEGLVTIFTGGDTNGVPAWVYPILSTYIGGTLIWGWSFLTDRGWKPSEWADINAGRMWLGYVGKFLVAVLIGWAVMPITVVKRIIAKNKK